MSRRDDSGFGLRGSDFEVRSSGSGVRGSEFGVRSSGLGVGSSGSGSGVERWRAVGSAFGQVSGWVSNRG
jgi:hypothetical protein